MKEESGGAKRWTHGQCAGKKATQIKNKDFVRRWKELFQRRLRSIFRRRERKKGGCGSFDTARSIQITPYLLR